VAGRVKRGREGGRERGWGLVRVGEEGKGVELVSAWVLAAWKEGTKILD